MKYNNLCVLYLLTIFSFIPFNCNAQVINNKINVYFGFETGRFFGTESIRDKNFIYPSLYSNFKSINGNFFKILYEKNQFFSFGIILNDLKAHDWEYYDSLEYFGSKVNLQSLSPVIQIHNKFTKQGAFNRIRLFLEIAPVIGMSKLTLVNPSFNIYIGDNIVSPPLKSNDLFYGVKANSGIELTITQILSIYFAYSCSCNWVDSELYVDHNFSSSSLYSGVIMKFKKDKRYFY